MNKNYSFEDIENYIIDRELGFCDLNQEIENIILQNKEYEKISKVHKIITESMTEKEFLFKHDEIIIHNNEKENKKSLLSIISEKFKNILYPENLPKISFVWKLGAAALVMVVFLLPFKIIMERQLSLFKTEDDFLQEKVVINVKEYMKTQNQTQNQTKVVYSNEKQDEKIKISEDKTAVAKSDISINEDVKIDVNSNDENKSIESQNFAIKGSEKQNIEPKQNIEEKSQIQIVKKDFEKSTEKEEIKPKSIENEKIYLNETAVVKNEAKILKEEPKAINPKEEVLYSKSESKTTEKTEIKTNDNYIAMEKIVPTSTERINFMDENKRGKVNIVKTRDSNTRQSLMSEREIKVDTKIQTNKKETNHFIKVKGIENNKIYTKVKLSFETKEGYDYKYFINNEEYKEGTEYSKTGKHKFIAKIYKDNEFIDELEIKFEIWK